MLLNFTYLPKASYGVAVLEVFNLGVDISLRNVLFECGGPPKVHTGSHHRYPQTAKAHHETLNTTSNSYHPQS